MRIRILSNTSIKGEPVEKGRVVNVDKTDARILIGYDSAELYVEKIETLDGGEKAPEPTKRGRKKKDG